MYKVITMICIHLLFAAICAAFVGAMACGEYVIAAGCAAAYSVCKALYWADVENGGKGMRFEIIEYQKDDTGKEKQITAYEIEQFDLAKTIDNLNEDVKRGRISRFEVAYV